VDFTVEHSLLGTINGKFSAFEGTLTAAADGTVAKLTGKVQVVSISTNNTKRDEHLLNADFFDEPSFPVIEFVSTATNASSVTGNLTIHGVTKKITLNYVKEANKYKFSGIVNRLDFGVGTPKSVTNHIANEINIVIQIS
jgi:polyisoprenoid-binding protein YceI